MKRGFATVFAFIMLCASVEASGFGVLVPHRAIYEVSLVGTNDRSGIEDMTGRIVYELNGNACDGISIQYRFVTKIRTGNDTFLTDQQSASYESADGKEFSFSTKSFVNEQPDQDVTGTAIRESGGVSVSYAGKEPKELELSDALFTSSHLVAILESAEQGETFVSHTVFDGSGDADRILNSATVIGKERTINDPMLGESGEDLETLIGEPAFPMTMSYFDTKIDNSAEALPIYEASFLLYRNGVTRNLTMRYPEYELKATLRELKYLETTSCG